MADPIQEEIWKFRAEHARRFNYDVHAIMQDILKNQRERGLPLVDLSKKANLSKKRPTKPAKKRTSQSA